MSQAARRTITWPMVHVITARCMMIGRAAGERSHIEWRETKVVVQSVSEFQWAGSVSDLDPLASCVTIVRKKPNASVLIESSLQKLTASGFSKSAQQENEKTKQKWKPLLKFYSSQHVSSHIRTASPVSTQFCGYGKQTKKPRLFRL